MRALLLTSLLLLPLAARAGTAEIGAGVMELVHADRWAEADAAAAALPDPVARKLVTFYRLLAPGAARVAEIDAFRAANPGWPSQATLRRRREEAIAAEPDDEVALAACDRERPATAPALIRCAEGDLRQNRFEDAAAAVRAAWIAAPPDDAWETKFLHDWGQAIGPSEQWQRFDRLAWSDTAGAALQVQRLATEDQPRAEARLALRRDDPQAATLLASLSPEQRDAPAMVLEQARWLRRAGHDDQALALWISRGAAAERAAPAERRALFWNERNILARRLLAAGDAKGAYALAAGAAQAAPEQEADAAFLAGWIALRRLSDPSLAEKHFAVVAQVSRAVITQARAHYWLARAATAMGDAARAQREYAAASAYPSTYYGQLAILAGRADPARLDARIVARRDPVWDRAQALAFATSELVRASIWLVAWGEPGRAAAFLLALDEAGPNPTSQALAARLATGFGMPQTAVSLARLAGRSGVVLLDTGWPVAAAIPRNSPVDAALALGIIRQESSFDPAVISPAGARGLMQLMPATAAAEARGLGVTASAAALTTDPGLNVQLGSTYLAALLTRFSTSVPLAVAAYNAGPSRVTGWLAVNGDPRPGSGADGPDMTDWIELIPFSETRNYVQRVLENAVIYRAKLGETAFEPVPWPHSPA